MKFNPLPGIAAALPAAAAPPPDESTPFGETSKNLLKHLPSEATAFYLFAVAFLDNPGAISLGIIFAMALILLVLVRIMAKASIAIIVTSVVGFLIWMLMIENGFLAAIIPIDSSWGAVLAAFYSAVVTLLANKGWIE